MTKGVIIVSPLGQVIRIEDRSDNHESSLCGYIEANDLSFDRYKTYSGDILSLYLASLDYMVIHQDDDGQMIYVGEELTNEQYNWFQNNKDSFNDVPVGVKTLDVSMVKSYDKKINNNALEEIISNKVVVESKKVLEKIG